MITHVSLKSNDVLVVSVDDTLSPEAAIELRESIQRVLPTGTAVWIIDKSLKVEVLSVEKKAFSYMDLYLKSPEDPPAPPYVFDSKSVV